MANIRYIRVSTLEQNTARQHAALDAKDIEFAKTFEDKCSAKDTNRPQLQAMLEYCREGDTVYIESYSRLARNTRDLLNIIHDLKQKGVNVVSLKEKLDTSTPTGEFMLQVMAGVAQLERDLIKERQREGTAIAKAQGKFAKPTTPQPDNWKELYEQYRTRQITAKALAEQLGISRALLYKWFAAEKAQ